MATSDNDKTKGILLYQPRGAAGEYAKWAINLYNGCTHGCTYCYNRRGTLSHAFGDKPKLAAPIWKQANALVCRWTTLKKEDKPGCVITLDDAWEYYTSKAMLKLLCRDIDKIGADRLRKDGGVFLSFKCDPLEKYTIDLTVRAIFELLFRNIPVTLLTKSTDWQYNELWKIDLWKIDRQIPDEGVGQLTIGFTITGMDDMEPNAPSTADRIALLKTIRERYPHIRTFVSLEPVIDITKAMNDVLYNIYGHTDEIRIGCQSPLKRDRYDPQEFLSLVIMLYKLSPSPYDEHIVTRITLKHSVRAQVEFFPPDIRYKCLALIQKIEDSQR